MSFCQWSSDNMRCDLYVYESDGGFITHVAGNRIVGDIPEVPHPTMENIDELREAYDKQRAFMETAQREEITLPHAGESFCDDTLEELQARVLILRELGYRFPDEVLEMIAEEIAEEQKENPSQ